MSLSLEPHIKLFKDGEPAGQFHIGLGWDPGREKQIRSDVDLDLHAYIFGQELQFKGKVSAKSMDLNDYTFNIHHSGDEVTGYKEGDDEVITLELGQMQPEIQYILIKIDVVSDIRFDEVRNAFVRAFKENGDEIFIEQIEGELNSSSMIFGSISRIENNNWGFKPICDYGFNPDDESWQAQIQKYLS